MHWRITAWELFATTIFLILEFYFVWSSSHIFTWVLAVVTVSVSLFLAFPMPIGVTLATIAMAVGLGTIELVPSMPLVETEMHGWLVPANDPTPTNACSNILPKGALLVILGDSAVWSPHNAFIAFTSGCSALSVKKDRQGLLLDVDLFADDGNLVARIKDNEFHLATKELSYTDRGDRSTLNIFGPKGEEVFHARYLNPTTLEVRGVFACPSLGLPLIIATDGIRRGENHIGSACTRASFAGFGL
jgi:hypothetical protein